MKIYIPVDKNFKLKNNTIAYLDDKGKIVEKFDCKLETIDGQNYITFVTTHLSVYGIIDETINPNTSDFIIVSFIVIGIAFALIVLISIKKPKRYV